MTKETAIQLLEGKDVYLTLEGKKVLLEIIKKNEGVVTSQ